jgi:hypothetical protein
MTHPSCMRTQPKPVFDASQNTSKGFSISGCAKTGAVVSNFCKIWKAASHSSVQANFLSFYNKLVIGLTILEKSGIKRR